MKLSPILIAAGLAFGGTAALAQSHDTTKRTDDDRAATTRKADEPTTAEKAKEGARNVGNATKRGAKRAAAATGNAAHRAADATRHVGESIESKLPHTERRGNHHATVRGSSGETGTPGATTTAMGSGPASSDMSGDANRRARMDDAYADWQRKHGDLKR